MHITKLELRNFKRFTDLTIDGIPPDTKLVLLIGSNGSGKSSVFDAFESINKVAKGQELFATHRNVAVGFDPIRYQFKGLDKDFIISIGIDSGEDVTINSGDIYGKTLPAIQFYGRSSLRQVPRLTRTQSNQGTDNEPDKDSDRPLYYIDRDNRFENDIDRVSRQIITEIFRGDASGKQIRERYVQPINEALSRVFDGNDTTTVALLEIIPPGEGQPAQLNFRKGQSEIHYDLLSAGEKEIVNILFNLLARKSQYTDTIYFFDELDLHLNTQLQFNLLKEITENWIPDNCQLWTASHSLGFIDYARQYESGVIIDFDDLDFDQPQTLYPQPKESLDVYDIAVPKQMLFEIMKDKRVVVCENQNDEYYNLLGLPNTIFVGMKDARSVFLQVKNDPRYHSLRDRDFLSDTEVARIQQQYPNHFILQYYDFENYLYHPDNVAELELPGFDKQAYTADIQRQKDDRLLYMLPNLTSSRQMYEEFKTDEKLRDKFTDSIVDDLKSEGFERFYKFFDMKSEFKKTYLMPFNISKERLVQTSWFRRQINAVINPSK